MLDDRTQQWRSAHPAFPKPHAAPSWPRQSVAEPKRQHAPPAPQYCAHPPGRLPHWIQQSPPGSPCSWRLLKGSKTSTAIAASSLRCRWLCKSVLHESTSCNIGAGAVRRESQCEAGCTSFGVLLDAAETKSRDESAAFETEDAFEKCSKDACSFRVPERRIHVDTFEGTLLRPVRRVTRQIRRLPSTHIGGNVSWITFRVRNIKEDGRVL